MKTPNSIIKISNSLQVWKKLTLNIKYLIKKSNILYETGTFHTDGNSLRSIQYNSMIVSFKNVKAVLNHNQNVVEDAVNEEKYDTLSDDDANTKISSGLNENELKKK